MTRIAHLTDLHLLEDRFAHRSTLGRARLRYLSLGRPLAPDHRRRHAAEALARAKEFDPDHLVITGDLTEDGLPAQFELAAELLADSGIPAQRITIVPGNHDFYDHDKAWERALEGPLRPYRIASKQLDPIDLGSVVIVPVCTAYHQAYTLSAGHLSKDDLNKIGAIARDPRFAKTAVVLAQHHPPFRYACTVLQWIDGFRSHRAERHLLSTYPNVFVMHGHIHAHQTFVLEPRGRARVFAGDAVVTGRPSLRTYEAAGADPLEPVPISPSATLDQAARDENW